MPSFTASKVTNNSVALTITSTILQTLTEKISDPENLIFVYLIIKAIIIVCAHYFGLSMRHTLVSPFLF